MTASDINDPVAELAWKAQAWAQENHHILDIEGDLAGSDPIRTKVTITLDGRKYSRAMLGADKELECLKATLYMARVMVD